MDKGAWQATVCGVRKESDTTEATKHARDKARTQYKDAILVLLFLWQQ